jgi:hypothetical protein
MCVKIARIVGFAVFITIIMPSGMLFGVELGRASDLGSRAANPVETGDAGRLLNRMRSLALRARRQVGPLQVQELELGWQDQAFNLGSAKWDINKIGADLARLEQMKKGLEPWQQRLVAEVTPAAHEMVYQMDEALAEIKADQSRTVLAMTPYPQNINMIHQQASQMAHTIRTFTQYAHAKQRLAALERQGAVPRS